MPYEIKYTYLPDAQGRSLQQTMRVDGWAGWGSGGLVQHIADRKKHMNGDKSIYPSWWGKIYEEYFPYKTNENS